MVYECNICNVVDMTIHTLRDICKVRSVKCRCDICEVMYLCDVRNVGYACDICSLTHVCGVCDVIYICEMCSARMSYMYGNVCRWYGWCNVYMW